MDEMRVIVAGMEAREDALLADRIDVASQSYSWARLTLLAASGMALVLVLALFLSARRVGTERWRARYTAERLQVTLKSIGDAVMTTDSEGHVQRLNPIAQTLTGWTEAEAAGKRVEDVFVIINEHTREPVGNPIRQVLRDGVVVGLANHTVLIAKDGREVPVEDSASPMKTAEGMVIGVVMVFRDVTERRAVERERAALIEAEQRARARSDQENRMKDDFLATLSHELRTPLSVILGWSDMLRRGVLDEPRRQRALVAIHENAALQVQMVDDLLDTARISSGKLQLARARVLICGSWLEVWLSRCSPGQRPSKSSSSCTPTLR
jgi:PAS domain S-box-containing protein